MANKLSIPAQAGAGSASHPNKKRGIPNERNPTLRIPGMRGQAGNLTHGQGFPRKT